MYVLNKLISLEENDKTSGLTQLVVSTAVSYKLHSIKATRSLNVSRGLYLALRTKLYI